MQHGFNLPDPHGLCPKHHCKNVSLESAFVSLPSETLTHHSLSVTLMFLLTARSWTSMMWRTKTDVGPEPKHSIFTMAPRTPAAGSSQNCLLLPAPSACHFQIKRGGRQWWHPARPGHCQTPSNAFWHLGLATSPWPNPLVLRSCHWSRVLRQFAKWLLTAPASTSSALHLPPTLLQFSLQSIGLNQQVDTSHTSSLSLGVPWVLGENWKQQAGNTVSEPTIRDQWRNSGRKTWLNTSSSSYY